MRSTTLRYSLRDFCRFAVALSVLASASVSLHAELDCPAIAEALKIKHTWLSSGSFEYDLRELIKRSDYAQYSSSSASKFNIAAVIEDVPVTFGGSMNHDTYDLVRSELLAGKTLKINQKSYEEFKEESLAEGAVDVIMACVTSQHGGFSGRLIRRASSDLVTLALIWNKPSSEYPDKITLKMETLSGLTFATMGVQPEMDAGKYELKTGERRVVSFRRTVKPTPSGSEVIYESALVGIRPSKGDTFDQEIPETTPSKNPIVSWDYATRTVPEVMIGGGGKGGGSYVGLHAGEAVSGWYHFVLPANVWPRNMDADALANNIVVTGGGIYHQDSGAFMYPADGEFKVSQISWNETTHEIKFFWQNGFRNKGNFNVLEAHARVEAACLTKTRTITY